MVLSVWCDIWIVNRTGLPLYVAGSFHMDILCLFAVIDQTIPLFQHSI
jgi:hypothetical protein